MIQLRRHPESSWTAPYEDVFLDDTLFQPLGRLTGVSLDRGVAMLSFSTGGCLRLTALQCGAVRVTVASDSSFPPDRLGDDGTSGIVSGFDRIGTMQLSETDTEIHLDAGPARITLNRAPFRLGVSDQDGKCWISSRPDGIRINRADGATLSFFDLRDEDHFFGFGGRIAKLDRRGRTADIFAVKVATERGDYGGLPMPYFINPRGGYGFLMDNPTPHVYFDLGREFPDRWFLHTPGGALDFYVIPGPTPADVARRYCELTGYPALPPKWYLGLWISWVGAHEQQDEILAVLERARKEGVPFDVFVADLYWRGGQLSLKMEGRDGMNLDWDGARFPDPAQFVRSVHDLTARLCLHVNTRMWAGATAEEGLRRGALRAAQEHQIVESVEDEAARAWCWNHYQPRVTEGADAWWTDNSERVDGTLKNGLPSRNLFGHLWNKFIYSGMAAAGHQGRLVLTRGAWLGAQRYAHTWPGDTGPGTDRLKEDLRWHLNCSTSGVPFNSVDLGGFVTYSPHSAKPSHQLSHYLTHSDDNVIRRIANSFLLFTIPRLHGGGQDRMPWQYNDRVRRIYLFFLRLRYRFTPHLWSLALHAHATGEPIYRPLVWHYPLDPYVYDVDDELLLGRDLLFAPVTHEGAGEREIYLPEGEWRHAFSGRVWTGGRSIVVNTPLYEPSGLPLFLRRGGFLALGAARTHISDTPESDLSIHLWPSVNEDRHILGFAPGEQMRISCRSEKSVIVVTLVNESTAPRSGSVIVPDDDGPRPETTDAEPFGGRLRLRFNLQPAESAILTIPSFGK